MILKQIEIENVKSHKKTIIPFKKGLNVFHGGNGTGKSTVLEMIGFVLFDFLEGRKQDIYVRKIHRDNPKFGTVRLSIIGLKNEPYIIERTIGKPSVLVTNVLTNKEVKQVTDAFQLKKWIRKQIRVSNNIELENLFETSIGIPQGTFLVPFRKTAGKRKVYFDPILDLKIYDDMWKKFKNLADKIYSPALEELNLQISEFLGEIKQKSDLIEKKDRVVEEVKILIEQTTKNKELYKTLKKELDQLEEVKNKLETVRQEVEKVTITRDKEQETVSNLQVQVDEAKKAKKICDATQKASMRYEKLFENQSTLQSELKNLHQNQQDLKILIENYASLRTQEEGINKNKKESEEAVERVKNLGPKYDRSLELEREIKQNEEDLTIIVTIEEGLEKKRGRLEDIKSSMQVIQNYLNLIPKLEQNFKEYSAVEKHRDGLQQEIFKLESKLVIFTQNREELEAGKCPIFNQPCKNLEEGDANFNDLSFQIEEGEEILNEKKALLQVVQKKLEKKNEVEKKLKELKNSRIKFGEIQKQETDLKKEISKDQESTIKKTSFLAFKEALEREKEELTPIIEAYRKNKMKAEELPSLTKNALNLNQQVEKLRKSKETKELSVKGLEHLPAELDKIQNNLKSLKENHDFYQTNKQLAEQLPIKEKMLRKTVESLNQLKLLLRNQEELVRDIESKFDGVKYDHLVRETKIYESKITESQAQVNIKQDILSEYAEDINRIEQIEKELIEHNITKDKLEVQTFFISKMRIWLREFVPKMRKALISQINVVASEIYRELREEQNAVLTWQEDYGIQVATLKSKRDFFGLSGGEKMSAALAVRLAILKVLTETRFAFFDEPTTNLDETTRKNLSKIIHNIKGFEQLFVISHDDSFKRHSEYVVKFTKDQNEVTHIDYLTKKYDIRKHGAYG